MNATAVSSPPATTAGVDTVKLPPPNVTLAVRAAGRTDRGKVRRTNQDQFLIATLRKALQIRQTSLPVPAVRYGPDECHLFVVADGMGGHSGGEEASALAIDSVEAFILATFKWFERVHGPGEDKLLADFQEALGRANGRVLAEAEHRPHLHGMGTTLTLAYTLNDMLFVAHVGDSRCYLFRHDSLHRMTRDHNLVEELVRRGQLKPEEAATHHWRHVITNVVGGDSAAVTVEVHKLELAAGDVLLLCSDGLTNRVSDDGLAAVLRAEADPEQACRVLIDRANAAGGDDYITAVVARFEAGAAADQGRHAGDLPG
jgi:protein phosphatase